MTRLSYVQLGEIAWCHEIINRVVRPERRDSEAYRSLQEQLTNNGWLATLGVIDVFDQRSRLFKEHREYKTILDLAYQNRLQEHDALQTNTVKASCFAQAFCNDKGDVIHPRLIANTCNGRLDVYFDSQVARVENTNSRLEPVFQVPVQCSIYETEKERVDQQVAENRKLAGHVECTSLQKLDTIRWYVSNYGSSQSEMRTRFPGTIGQKGWLVCRLDQLWSDSNRNELFDGEQVIDGVGPRPNLALVERCHLKSKEPQYVNFASLNNVTELVDLVARSSPQGLEQRNARRNDVPLTPLGWDELAAYFSGGVKAKVTKRTIKVSAWESYLSNETKLLQDIAKAQLSGNPDIISSKLICHADVYNKVYDLLDRGKKSEVLTALGIPQP